MSSGLEIKLILCDAAVADPSGKLHMIGAGWSVTRTPTIPHAVAIMIKIPWNLANQRIPFALSLLDPDGHPVFLDLDGAEVPIGREGEIEAGRPHGLAPGIMLDAALAISFLPLALAPGRYEWRLTLDDQSAREAFTVRA